MRNVFDQLFKDLASELLSPWGTAQPALAVVSDAQEADLVFEPSRRTATVRERELGLFGRMTNTVCLLEAFHATPDRDEVLDCIRKQLTLHRQRTTGGKPRGEVISLWVISSGRPEGVLRGLALDRMPGWGPGFYRAKLEHLPVRLVVVSELPVSTQSLLLRLMGTKKVLKAAVGELKHLPPGMFMRRVATDVLARLRLQLERKTGPLEAEEEELLMITDAEFQVWKQSIVEESVLQALRRVIREMYEEHSGAMPRSLASRLDLVTDEAELGRLNRLAASRPANEFEQALPKKR